jgi:type IV pilus assembly protein PilN
MLEINLLPVREARRKADLRQQVMQLVLALIVTCAGIGLAHSKITDQREMAQKRIRQMEDDIERFQPQIEQVAVFKKKKSQLEKKIDVIDGLDQARSGPVRLLDELASRAPERLWLTKLKTKGKTVELEGQSLDNELVAVFLGELNSSKYFDEVDLDETKIQDSRSGGLKLVSFEITARLVTGGHDGKAKKGKKRGRKGRKA